MARRKTDFTNIKCLVCGKGDLTSKTAFSEDDGKGFRTGRWFCSSCYNKVRYKNGTTNANLINEMRDRRTNNLNPNSTQAKGDNSQKLACILYGWEDLNNKYNNHKVPIDCYDPKTGLYHQVQGRYYNSVNGQWPFANFERDWGKIFEDMVCFCFSEDGKIVERIYKFPWKEIMRVKGISIYKNPTDCRGNAKFSLYDQYRVNNKDELKKANELC